MKAKYGYRYKKYKEFGALTLKGFSFIALEGIFASLIGHFAYYYALKLGETSKIVPIISAFPVITVILAVVFLAEKMTVYKGAGIALIVLIENKITIITASSNCLK